MRNANWSVPVAFFVTVLLIGQGLSPIHAEDRTIIFDGVYWKQLSELGKARFMQGYVNGRDAGYEAGRFDALESLSDIPGVTGPRFAKAYAVQDTNSGDGYTFGQLVSGMDECYKDFRNEKLPIDDCFVWTIWGIKGIPDAKREGYLEYMRKQAAGK